MQHPPVKDYYRILGISTGATSDEIKKAYRKLAFASHPDRNPGEREQAEHRFKEITEAYGVLIDPRKRRQFDQIRNQTTNSQHFSTGSGPFSSEQIFRDLFQNPYARKMFQDLQQEFLRQGFRFDSNFVKRTLFGGKGMFIGGIFFFTLFNSRGLSRSGPRPFPNAAQQRLQTKKNVPLLRLLGEKIGLLPPGAGQASQTRARKKDLFYELSISQGQAARGDRIALQFARKKKQEKLWVTIPPGIKSGTKLRLAGKGKPGRLGSPPGDLFIKVFVQDK